MATVAFGTIIPPARAATVAARTSTTIKSLDGVRGLAILLVLWCHLDGALHSGSVSGIPALLRVCAASAGGFGVYLFFVLSGFLLFLPYARALAMPKQTTWPRARTFYLRRMKRILPSYLIVYVAMIGLMLWTATQHHTLAQFPWLQLIPGLFLLYDFHPITFNLIAGANPTIGLFDAPLWSLTVEWQFYLLLPLLAWGLARLRTLRRVTLALLLLILVGLALRAGATWAHYTIGGADRVNVPGVLGLLFSLLYGMRGKYLEIFALGMLASLFYVWAIEHQRWTLARRRILALVLLPLGAMGFLCCCVWSLVTAQYPSAYWPPSQALTTWYAGYLIAGNWILGLCATALLFTVLCLPHSWGAVFSLRPLTTIGLISYSLYLWHWPILLLDVHLPARLPLVLVLALILLWSAVLYYIVERPFLRHQWRKNQ